MVVKYEITSFVSDRVDTSSVLLYLSKRYPLYSTWNVDTKYRLCVWQSGLRWKHRSTTVDNEWGSSHVTPRTFRVSSLILDELRERVMNTRVGNRRNGRTFDKRKCEYVKERVLISPRVSERTRTHTDTHTYTCTYGRIIVGEDRSSKVGGWSKRKGRKGKMKKERSPKLIKRNDGILILSREAS